MKIERIDENKIKVIVFGDDVRRWNVDLKNFTENTPEAQDMFWFALKQAEEDVNFMVGKSQLMVETMPSEGEGFVLIISRMENEAALAEALVRAGKQLKQTEIKMRKKRPVAPLFRIFAFNDFEEVCTGIAEIRELYMGTSRLTKYGGRFYLELTPIDSFGFFEIENILSEFAEKVKNPVTMQGMLNEHGTVMIESDVITIVTENFIK